MSERNHLLALTALSTNVLLHDDEWISWMPRAGRHPANVSWDESGKWSRAFGREIRCDLWSSIINDTKNSYEHDFQVEWRPHSEPAWFWGNAYHRRRHLGLAARSSERT